MPGRRSRTGNQLLDRVLRFEPTLREHLESVSMPLLHEFYRPGDVMSHVHFPTNGVLSLVHRFKSGEMAEVGTIGSEGLANLHALLEVRKCPLYLLQQVPGEVLRLPTADLLRAREANPNLERLIRCYAAYAWRAAQQFSSCNLTHRIMMRAARWILMTADRVGSEEIKLTQEVLAQMLGVTRQAVNETARGLQEAGLIQYRRGNLTIVDRSQLESVSCECYGIINGFYRELF